MADDVADPRFDLHWRIKLAREGAGGPLAEYIRELDVDPSLRDFLIGIVTGAVKLPRRKLTYQERHHRYLREFQVVEMVDYLMGKRRDKHERNRLTAEWSKNFGTTEDQVANFLNQIEARRRAGLPLSASRRRKV
jgi:hypothetical protein